MGTSAMARRVFCHVGLAALCLWAASASADPSPGFGLYVGPISSNYPAVYGTSRGIAIGTDAQFVYDADWTLSPYLSASAETSNSVWHVTELTGGLQARRWIDQWFFGGQFLFHSTFLTLNGQTRSGSVGPSLGLVAGWESQSHWSLVLQADALEGNGFSWFNGNASRHDIRLLIGYHWY